MPSFDQQRFCHEFNTQGYSVVPYVLDDDFIWRAKKALEEAIATEVEWHKGETQTDYGMVLLCSLYAGPFLELFENETLLTPFNAILGSGCIAYAYTSSSMPPFRTNYSNRIHVDCPRIIPGYTTNVGATVLLDDFTLDNGATYFLPYSQQLEAAPSKEQFHRAAKRLVAKAGTVWYFNARLWHAGGTNNTDAWRHALTINMCRPWMKQRIDIPHAMQGMDLSEVSERALQKLGFYAQVPRSYAEYYVSPEHRKFRQDTE